METRIIPHINFDYNSTWWRVDVKKIVFRLGRFKIWKWETVGDYPTVGDATFVSNAIKKLEVK